MADSSTAVVLLDTDPSHAMKTLTHSDCTVPVHQGRPDRPYEPETVRDAPEAGSISDAVNNKVRPMVNSHPIAPFLMVNSHPIAIFLMVNSHPIALPYGELSPHHSFS